MKANRILASINNSFHTRAKSDLQVSSWEDAHQASEVWGAPGRAILGRTLTSWSLQEMEVPDREGTEVASA